MQSLRSTPSAHEAEEYPAMSQSTTEIRIVPLAPTRDVLTDLLRDGARRLLAQAVEAEVAAWIDDHAHLKDDQGRRQVVDRKSTRLNSSHSQISYAVFCLKKKKTKRTYKTT